MKIPRIRSVFAFIALLALMTGLMVGCKGSLESGGAYTESITNSTSGTISQKQDKFLYTSDATFDLVYKSMKAAFAIERNNRAYFWQISPEIKHSLDKIRPQTQQAINAYATAREVYLSRPSPTTQDAVQKALDQAQLILNSINAIVAQYVEK